MQQLGVEIRMYHCANAGDKLVIDIASSAAELLTIVTRHPACSGCIMHNVNEHYRPACINAASVFLEVYMHVKPQALCLLHCICVTFKHNSCRVISPKLYFIVKYLIYKSLVV